MTRKFRIFLALVRQPLVSWWVTKGFWWLVAVCLMALVQRLNTDWILSMAQRGNTCDPNLEQVLNNIAEYSLPFIVIVATTHCAGTIVQLIFVHLREQTYPVTSELFPIIFIVTLLFTVPLIICWLVFQVLVEYGSYTYWTLNGQVIVGANSWNYLGYLFHQAFIQLVPKLVFSMTITALILLLGDHWQKVWILVAKRFVELLLWIILLAIIYKYLWTTEEQIRYTGLNLLAWLPSIILLVLALLALRRNYKKLAIRFIWSLVIIDLACVAAEFVLVRINLGAGFYNLMEHVTQLYNRIVYPAYPYGMSFDFELDALSRLLVNLLDIVTGIITLGTVFCFYYFYILVPSSKKPERTNA